jgi:DNA-binding response OmpR family regulator
VITEESDLAGILRRLLSRVGCDVVTADSVGGIRATREVRPQLVILDLGLHKVAGTQLLEQLRDVSDAKILLMVQLGQDLPVESGLRGQAANVLVKPFRSGELIDRVQALLAGTAAATRHDVAEGERRHRSPVLGTTGAFAAAEGAGLGDDDVRAYRDQLSVDDVVASATAILEQQLLSPSLRRT